MTSRTVEAQSGAAAEKSDSPRRRDAGVFPDPLPREDMQNAIHLHRHGYLATLNRRLNPNGDAVIVTEAYLGWNTGQRAGTVAPDLMIAFNAGMAGAVEANGYSIEEQGKPPDFVLEIASRDTGRRDIREKREAYAGYGVREYWRFDGTGGLYHREALAGDILVGGEYRPAEIERLDENRLRGYSEALGLHLCWERGVLRWYDPAAEAYLLTQDEAEAARLDAEMRADAAEAEHRRLTQRLRELGLAEE